MFCFSSKKFTPFCFLALFVLIALANGGREVIGLCLYQIFSILLFYATFRESKFTKARACAFDAACEKTFIDKPLIFFLFVSGISTLYALWSHLRGLVHFSTILVHCFNFYSLVKIKEDWFKEKFFDLIILVSSLFSLGFIVQVIAEKPPNTFLPNPNLLAIFIGCGIVVALSKLCFCSFILSGGTAEEAQRSPPLGLSSFRANRQIIWGWILILLMLSAELSLFSRGALIALGLGLFFLLTLNYKKFLIPLAGIAAAALILILFHPIMQVTASKILSSPDNTRIVVWKGAISAFLEKPIFGWGLGTFGQVYQLHKFPIESDIGQYEKTTRFAHNEFLQIAVEMGILGLISFSWLVFVIVRRGIAILKRREETDWKKNVSVVAILMLLFHSLLDFNLHLPILSFLFVFFTYNLNDNLLKTSD